MKFFDRFPRKARAVPPALDTSGPARYVSSHVAGGRDAAATIRSTIERALQAAGLEPATRRADVESPTPVADPAAQGSPSPCGARGQFLRATHGDSYGRRDYRLYLPAGHDVAGAPRPLVLMLHGCTQSAEDFAVGTRMNALADRHGFLVAYPQQVGKANHAKCWNWFRPEDQRGDAGEPAILAGILQQVARDHRIDPRRIFVAGLSAGAAMAVILGRTRPDVVRAIGVHSGLPYGIAHDVPSAFAAMQGRNPSTPPAGAHGPVVPMILFHGDEDRTVVASNATALAASAACPSRRECTERGRSPGGRDYTRRVVLDEQGGRCLEHWTLHGGGHAWSGGDAAGSYTDPTGPDASAAMVDFFLGLDRGPSL